MTEVNEMLVMLYFRGVKYESGDQQMFMKALLTVAGYAVSLEASNVRVATSRCS